MKILSTLVGGVLIAALSTVSTADQQDDFDGGKRAAFEAIAAKNKARLSLSSSAVSKSATESAQPQSSSGRCIEGMSADTYPCDGIDLLSHVDITTLGVTFVNDMWGWTDWSTRREYALVGATEGTVVVDVTNPRESDIVGTLPSASLDPANPFWRDIKVYRNHAFIISEQTDHGMQVLDLRQLRRVERSKGPVELEEAASYNEFSTSHNIAINRDSGYAYVVGADTCMGGLEMINIRRPSEPTDAGCYAERGYIHDAQCVNYYGPDSAYWGHEICFCASANTGTADSPFINSISIIDVTDKNNVVEISNSPYGDGFGYSHQGWLTGDRRFYLHNDELDEFFGTVATTNTRIWDMTDLDSPKFVGDSTNGATSIDHNMYTRGRRAYASNYTSGLRVFDSRRSNLRQGHLDEVAFFDMYPENDNATFEGGTWSNYSFFVRRSVIGVSSMDRGLFMLSVRASQRDDDDDDDEDDNDEND